MNICLKNELWELSLLYNRLQCDLSPVWVYKTYGTFSRNAVQIIEIFDLYGRDALGIATIFVLDDAANYLKQDQDDMNLAVFRRGLRDPYGYFSKLSPTDVRLLWDRGMLGVESARGFPSVYDYLSTTGYTYILATRGFHYKRNLLSIDSVRWYIDLLKDEKFRESYFEWMREVCV